MKVVVEAVQESQAAEFPTDDGASNVARGFAPVWWYVLEGSIVRQPVTTASASTRQITWIARRLGRLQTSKQDSVR